MQNALVKFLRRNKVRSSTSQPVKSENTMSSFGERFNGFQHMKSEETNDKFPLKSVGAKQHGSKQIEPVETSGKWQRLYNSSCHLENGYM